MTDQANVHQHLSAGAEPREVSGDRRPSPNAPVAAAAERVPPPVIQAGDQGSPTSPTPVITTEDVPRLRRWAGCGRRSATFGGAEALYRQAVDQGDTSALRHLAERREWAVDRAGVEALYRQAADHSEASALTGLACQATYHAVRADGRREAFGRPT